MTIELFMFLFTVGSTVSSLLTQAMKKALTNLPSNLIALSAALIVGVCGTLSAYVLMDIVIGVKEVVCVGLMTVCVAIGSMEGYDKVMQTLQQIGRG